MSLIKRVPGPWSNICNRNNKFLAYFMTILKTNSNFRFVLPSPDLRGPSVVI